MANLDHFLPPPGTRPEALDAEQLRTYLARIGLDPTLSSPSTPVTLSLLRKVQLAHVLAVPFETTANFFPSSWGSIVSSSSSTPLLPMNATDAPTPVEKVEALSCILPVAFKRVVSANRGGFCFVLNHLFACLLRSLGFKVSELSARIYIHRGKDPKDAGYDWTMLSHQCSLVQCPGEGDGKRYLVDVGFGGGTPPYPIPLEHGAETDSVSPVERFRVQNIKLPGFDNETSLLKEDSQPGWMVERWIGSYWTPLYWADASSRTEQDLEMLCWWNTSAPTAPFRNLLVITRLLPNGSRRTVMWDRQKAVAHRASTGKELKVRAYTKKTILSEDEDVSELEATEEELWRICSAEFGFRPWSSVQ